MTTAIVLFDDMTALDAIGPYEALWRIPGMGVETVSAERRPVSTGGGVRLVPSRTFDELTRPEILLVPGGPGHSAVTQGTAALDYVRSVGAQAEWVASVCSGAMILARAGLLGGLTASTHSQSISGLAEMGVTVSPTRVTVDGRVITSAGVSAGIDLGITLAGLLTDDVTAQAIQLGMEYAPEPPYEVLSPADAPPAVLARLAALRSVWFGT